jgi:thymidylate synthase ThyX
VPERRIYVLSPKELSPETIAVAFAKTSRSPENFDAIAAGLTDEKSSQFHEKWVVGYGHASVAEHAVLHIALENISRLAIESVESNRLASYTEKSTRYQKWEPGDFHVPAELGEHALLGGFTRTCDLLFATYREALAPVRNVVIQRTAPRENESPEALDRRVRSQYVDVCRFLLPAAALANVGMTANARVLESAIRKLLSHELQEVREIGEQLKAVASAEIPTLVKYAEAVPYLRESSRQLSEIGLPGPGHADARGDFPTGCELIDFDAEGEQKILAAALYRHHAGQFAACLEQVRALSGGEREALAERLLGGLDLHDVPLRELEHTSYTFDLVMDQGAYAEFKRHRMMTQTPQKLSTDLGYSVPRLMVDAGLGPKYEAAMRAADRLYQELSEVSPSVAQYIVPNGFHRRVLAKLNLREAFAFCELRSAPNAHFSIRKIAGEISEHIRRVHPLLAKYMRLPAETARSVQDAHFVAG